jgi:putative transposase
MKRMAYLRRLRELIPTYGSENVVYVDESGFKKHAYRMEAWAKRGKKVYGDVSGNNRKSTNLIMAWRRKKWLAPETFEGSCNAQKFMEWLTGNLLLTLDKPSIIVMDNAAFHKKSDIFECLKNAGHFFLPLPPYSPDFNPIEKAFATIKKIRQSNPNDPVINIIKSSDYYLK